MQARMSDSRQLLFLCELDKLPILALTLPGIYFQTLRKAFLYTLVGNLPANTCRCMAAMGVCTGSRATSPLGVSHAPSRTGAVPSLSCAGLRNSAAACPKNLWKSMGVQSESKEPLLCTVFSSCDALHCASAQAHSSRTFEFCE